MPEYHPCVSTAVLRIHVIQSTFALFAAYFLFVDEMYEKEVFGLFFYDVWTTLPADDEKVLKRGIPRASFVY